MWRDRKFYSWRKSRMKRIRKIRKGKIALLRQTQYLVILEVPFLEAVLHKICFWEVAWERNAVFVPDSRMLWGVGSSANLRFRPWQGSGRVIVLEVVVVGVGVASGPGMYWCKRVLHICFLLPLCCQALTMSTVVLVSMCRYSIHMIDLRPYCDQDGEEFTLFGLKDVVE